jgi:CRP/FNR family transcriptional regulator
MDVRTLSENGACIKQYRKNEIIFEEGSLVRFFYLIISGKVEMFCLSDEGKEFTLGVFHDLDSFGEPPLFLNLPYPASARAKEDIEILRLSKDKFLDLLEKKKDLKDYFLKVFARRIYSKTLSQNSLSHCEPEKRILLFIEKFKFDNDIVTQKHTVLPYTRQELANFTGLRIETIIRTLARMKTKGTLHFKNKKVLI